MKRIFIFILLFKCTTIVAQTSTNSTGTGNFNNANTWTSPKDLTGTANILNGHTIAIPEGRTFYANKVTFTGSAKLALTNSTTKWETATSMNASPAMESLNLQQNWSLSSVWAGDAFGLWHYVPWIDSYQAWSAGSANNGTDYLQYDLLSPRWVQGIVTQGRANSAQWVTSAKVETSIDNVNWATVSTSLSLNTDQNTKVYRNFPQVMFARYVRVTPIGVNAHASMRLGILLRDNIFKSCKEIIDNFPNASSGVYTIDPDGTAGATPATSCYCDMTTDGGGWTLVLNYLHAGGTNPALAEKSNALPLLGSTSLGVDESASATTWGHTIPSYLTKFTFSELRFYGKTSAHARVIHFKTSNANTISYFKTGTGSMNGVSTSYTSLSGHSAFLPASTANYIIDQGNSAMTNFPMYLNGTYHWGIKGSTYRWEVDDFPNNSANSTYNQIWIR
ncbi:MAG: discoidin domain-containing protein [Sediminibacterium sp.]|nr:discoidin domain-containing protein [Sediminibacterium sp.]MBP6144816.1 discoidin domain-containing protein [Sediminibacterium sp.]